MMCDSKIIFGNTSEMTGCGPVTLHCAHAPRKGRRQHTDRSTHFAVINRRWITWDAKHGLDLATFCWLARQND